MLIYILVGLNTDLRSFFNAVVVGIFSYRIDPFIGLSKRMHILMRVEVLRPLSMPKPIFEIVCYQLKIYLCVLKSTK